MNAPQTMPAAPSGGVQQIPNTTPVVWNLNVEEAAFILELIDERPRKQVQVLFTRLQAQANQCVLDALNPPQPIQPIAAPPAAQHSAPMGLPLLDLLLYAKTHKEAVAALSSAESNRREGDGSLDVIPTGDPEVDYASSLTIITRAIHHLDEALPNGQRARCLYAYAALEYGTTALGWYLSDALVRPTHSLPAPL